VAGCDLLIEAVVERLDVKREVLGRLAPLLAPDALVASNTSTLPIGALAEAVPRPERVLGLHFFSPARVMRLVEVVRAAGTGDAAAAAALAHVQAVGKVPVLVGDCYGFVSNRLSMAYFAEATRCSTRGRAPPRWTPRWWRSGCRWGP
jgi:3-hydroxyacyl-CoA dehydrogenase